MIRGLAVSETGIVRSGQERLSLALKRARTCLHILCMFRGCHAEIQLIWTHHVSSACQAEENVVCNFKCMATLVSHCCHLDSRSAVTDAGVHLPCTQGLAVYSLFFTSSMPGAPTKSTMDNLIVARQKVGPPSILGANPNNYFLNFLKSVPNLKRMDMFNGMFSLYLNGRFFKQRAVQEEFWTEDPKHSQRRLSRAVSSMITMLLRHNNDQQIRSFRRNRSQGDVALIDFLRTDVMKRNFPTLCHASLWALAHCMEKKRFTFGTVKRTNKLRGDNSC